MRFEIQAREIVDAHRTRAAGPRDSPAGEPRDEIPLKYRLDEARRIENYVGPSRLIEFARPGARALLALLLIGLWALAGSIHSYTRDLPGYHAYLGASSCPAASVDNGPGPAFCAVTDGVVESPIRLPADGLYELTVGPVQQSAGSLYVGISASEVSAYFSHPQPALDGLVPNDRIDYVAANGGDVMSVTLNGVTYQTADSPSAQLASDRASILASGFLTLLFVGMLGLKIARRRLRGRWGLLPLAVAAAFVTDVAVAAGGLGTPPASVSSLLGLTGVVMFCTVAAVIVLGSAFRLRARRLASRRHPAMH